MENTTPPPQHLDSKTNKSKTMVIGVIVLVLIVVFGCLLVGLIGNSNDGNIQIKIIYSGSWSGSIGDDSGQRSVDGRGTQVFDMKGGTVVAVIQKMDSGGTLTVQILQDGKVIETQSTSAEYGVVSVSHTF